MTTDRTTRKPGSAKGQIQIAADFDAPLQMTSDLAVSAPQAEEPKEKKECPLTAEEQNEIMVEALNNMYEIYMMFDHPHPDEFGVLALRTLTRIGRLKKHV